MLARLEAAVRGVGWDAVVQVGATLVLVAVVLAVAFVAGVRLGSDPVRAVGRGLVQVIAMGFLLTAILAAHAGWAALVLLAMCAVAADISRRRAKGGAFLPGFTAIVAGTMVTVVAMLAMGALDTTIRDLVPVGSIIVATCMRTASLAFERLEREREVPMGVAPTLVPETAAPGAPQAKQESRGPARRGTMARLHPGDPGATAVHASLIPAIDGMRSLGLVWIPGIMTGLVLAGVSPVRAALLQFVVVALGFVAAVITSLAATALLHAQDNP